MVGAIGFEPTTYGTQIQVYLLHEYPCLAKHQQNKGCSVT